MPNDYLDIRSPYIKSNVYSLENTRKNTISLTPNDLERDSSDNFLNKKITNISKRIVGDEIRKFAEVASREISQEFNNLENKIYKNAETVIENTFHDYFDSLKDEVNNDIRNQVNSLGYDLGKELDIKIRELNSLINQSEERLVSLENYTNILNQKITTLYSKIDTENNRRIDNDFNNNSKIIKEPIFKINRSEEFILNKAKESAEPIDNEAVEKKTILKLNNYPETSTLYIENQTTHDLLPENNLETKAEITEIIQPEIKVKNLEDFIKLFDKKGFLFKKNSFLNLKDLIVKEVINNRVSLSEDITLEDLNILKSNLEDILENKKVELNNTETVYNLLKRVLK